MTRVAPILFALVIALVGCANDEALRASVEKELNASLSIGDGRAKIESVLKEKKMPFNYNLLEHRYETGIDPKEKRSVKRVITVDIYLDGSDCLKLIEVRNTYTYL